MKSALLSYKQLFRLALRGAALFGWTAFTSKARAGNPLFTRMPSGEWEALDGYYQARFKGARVGQEVYLNVNGKPQVSVFAWSELSHDNAVRGRKWTLGANPGFGEIQVGHHRCHTILLSLAKAVSETDNVTWVYDPDIRNTVDERWGP
ncbi:hypothetical protein K5D34_12355 [Pseudomonas cichorii]|nr:hypothetical protein [Pseudomonas cichorii]MBX8510470.1 hypothetical protein [Pseudomonas cichorii]MBX8518742.1 hypothetical protein [Pseudomonas cichorii]MBX8523861.1 hypothetical protein [Pseudomonas cichorii]MBX8536430.1 hypothetical protein [Pseudomonas cichorii]MBX8548004.1 hypothetical protein [Pseudomonas cichorii]